MPTPLLTQRPPAPLQADKDSSGKITYRGQRTFDVTDVDNAAAAYAMVVAEGYDWDSPYDDEHPDAVVTGVSKDFKAGMYTFVLTFGDAGGGSEGPGAAKSIKYETYTYTEPADKDVNGVPYRNSAGTPFDPPLMIEKTGVIVTIKIPRATYPMSTVVGKANRVNSGTLTFPDGNSVGKGQAKFLGVFMPEKFLGPNAGVSQDTEVKFDCRPDGWKKNVLDMGAEAWGKDADNQFFRGDIGMPGSLGAAGPVLLDGNGKPIKSELYSKVIEPATRRQFGLSIVPPAASLPDGIVNDDLSTENITILSFDQYLEDALTGLF